MLPHPRSQIVVLLCLLGLCLLTCGCGQVSRPAASQAADREIRTCIARIREAILAKSAAGIVASATTDWTFTGADGTPFDRAAFITRTEALFARVRTIESLETQVDRISWTSRVAAEVEITQTMVRTEQAADPGAEIRLRLRYRERHTWVHTNEGWRVQRVSFIGLPERTILTHP